LTDNQQQRIGSPWIQVFFCWVFQQSNSGQITSLYVSIGRSRCAESWYSVPEDSSLRSWVPLRLDSNFSFCGICQMKDYASSKIRARSLCSHFPGKRTGRRRQTNWSQHRCQPFCRSNRSPWWF